MAGALTSNRIQFKLGRQNPLAVSKKTSLKTNLTRGLNGRGGGSASEGFASSRLLLNQGVVQKRAGNLSRIEKQYGFGENSFVVVTVIVLANDGIEIRRTSFNKTLAFKAGCMRAAHRSKCRQQQYNLDIEKSFTHD